MYRNSHKARLYHPTTIFSKIGFVSEDDRARSLYDYATCCLLKGVTGPLVASYFSNTDSNTPEYKSIKKWQTLDLNKSGQTLI